MGDYHEQDKRKVLPLRSSEEFIRSRRVGRFGHSGTVRGLLGAGEGAGSAIKVQWENYQEHEEEKGSAIQIQ